MMSNPYTDDVMWWIETHILDLIFMKRMAKEWKIMYRYRPIMGSDGEWVE